MTGVNAPPVVQDTVERYHAALDAGDYDLMMTTMTDDVVLRSPITGRVPIVGAEDVRTLVTVVLGAMEGLTSRQGAVDERTGLIHFEATVRGVQIEGVDLLQFNDEGLITELRIFIRPLPGLMTLMAAVGPGVARSNGRPLVALLAAMIWPMVAAMRLADRFVVPAALRRRGRGSRPRRAG